MGNTRYLLDNKDIFKTDYNILYISKSKFENDWHSTAHFHPFTEIFFITSGKGSFHLGNKIIDVCEGDFILINPNCLHTEKSKYTDQPLEYIVLGVDNLLLYFSKDNNTITNYSDNNSLIQYSIIPCKDKSTMLNYLNCLIKELTEKDINYELSCKCLLELLIVEILRYSKKEIKIRSQAKHSLSLECMQIKNYIDSHYSHNITLDYLVNLAHLNKYYLVHSFTKNLGVSPINYLIKKRIDEACTLLATTNYSIKDISSIVGFSNSSYFSQMFKKIMQQSPKNYKDSLKH